MDNSNNDPVAAPAVKKKPAGRRKIPIELIRKKSSRQSTFCKRRQGLFKKAAELSVLCGAQITILVRSPSDNIYTFGDPEALIANFQSGGGGGDVQESRIGHEDHRRRDQESGSFGKTSAEGMDLQEFDAYAEFLESLKAEF